MQVRDAAIAQVLDHGVVALDPWARLHFLRHVRPKCGLLGDFAGEAHTVQHGVDVVTRFEKLELDLGCGQWIGAFQAQPSPSFGPQVHRRNREARPLVRIDAVAVAAFD